MEYVTLNNGVAMSMLGYGCFLVSPEECERCVTDAIEIGYRAIDTAQAYYNEKWVGNAVSKAIAAGKVKAIGVSNFYPDRFMDLALFSEVRPMVNQLETHVFQQHKNDRRFIEKYGAKVEAWAPFARGEKGIFTNPVLTSIGQKYGKTTGQIALRFLVQSGIPVIPKSTHKERMEENLNIFDFQLSAEEMAQIEELDQGGKYFYGP